ncbi:hypothetical protein BGZ60DRAFT_470787 [Tricladium varicosporioides]|nr:hypothetical protein BGZ60DRAFT_470787 [Hymenoscyphus varicosporioides]
MASLDINLRYPVSAPIRPIAVEYLWGLQPSELARVGDRKDVDAFFHLYFTYYTQQCDLIGRHANGKYSTVETHKDIADIAKLLRQPLSRKEVRDHLSTFLRDGDEEQHDNSINLVGRLLLMTKLGNIPHECLGGKHVIWDNGSLTEFVHNYFSCPLVVGNVRTKFEKSFNAVNLQRIAGIEIWWTDNLADHLRMSNDDKAVAIFHHVSFLKYQRNNPIFPPGFIEETLRTLALLFPKYDPLSKKWYQSRILKSNSPLDAQLMQIGTLNARDRQARNFEYWHERLVILKEQYHEARPSTLSQWWYDRRNGVQWYTFWVAICVLALTILFGFIQCIEGGLQVYKSFHP